jgi:hypothetical protein
MCQRENQSPSSALVAAGCLPVNEKVVVVVGDWFIDENWLVTRQNLYQSSQPGEAHYQIRQTGVANASITLCGAAAQLSMLDAAFGKEKDCRIEAYGVWNHGDDETLQCTLCTKHADKKHLTLFTLASLLPPVDQNGNRYTKGNGSRYCPYDKPLQPCTFQPNLTNLANEGTASTNRIVRCYEGWGGGEPKVLYRFDWELPLQDGEVNYAKIPPIDDGEVVAVVIVDHGKGVVTPACIHSLLTCYGPASTHRPEWYLRTKVDRPAWFNDLPKNFEFSLVVTDFKTAEHRKQGRRWWHQGELGRAALEILGELTGQYRWEDTRLVRCDGPRSKRAAVLLDDNTLFGIEWDDKGKGSCVGINDRSRPKMLINTGRTSVFFGALVTALIRERIARASATPFAAHCRVALDCGYRWTREATDLWKGGKARFFPSYEEALQGVGNVGTGGSEPADPALDFDECWRRWNDSSKDEGIVEIDKNNWLQCWRAEGSLREYICVGGPKRNDINRLVAALKRFKDAKQRFRPFSCMLVSSPGWGKSFLARCLAKHLGLEYLEFSIAQMATTADVVDMFTTVSSVQSRVTSPLLVFVDEMNADIEGHSAVPLFLGPLWDGFFLRDGKVHHLNPAAWVFASTRDAAALGVPKISDLVSRLTGPIVKVGTPVEVACPPPSTSAAPSAEGQMARTEQVYFMVRLLRRRWGPLMRIQKNVLELFSHMTPTNGFRSMEIFADSFEGIRGGEVLTSNVPRPEESPELGRHIAVDPTWRPRGERDDEFILVEYGTQ